MKVFSAVFILICISILAAAQDSSPTPTPVVPVPQQLRILPQPGAPVRIVSAEIRWATPSDRFAVHVFPVVENISSKPIATYTTRRETDPTTRHTACLGPGTLPYKGLLPGEKKGTSTWQGDKHFDPAPAIWVDFVEFTDGTRWGTDECKTGESIDGGRAGVRAQRDQLLEIFRKKGAEALMAFIRDNYHKNITEEEWKKGVRPILPILPPSGHSRFWEEAFSRGASGIIERIIEAEQKWGPNEIEHELLRPIGPGEKKP
jgi:hypothetical protein